MLIVLSSFEQGWEIINLLKGKRFHILHLCDPELSQGKIINQLPFRYQPVTTVQATTVQAIQQFV